MKINENAIRARAAIVARDAAIVARAKTRTTDSPRRIRDVVLSAEPTPKNAAMLGTTWVGNLKAEIASLSAVDRKRALDAMRRVLDDYPSGFGTGTMGPSNSGSFGTGMDSRPETEFDLSTTATPDDLSGAAASVYDTTGLARATSMLTRDVARHSGGISTTDLQRINDRFWGITRSKQEAARGRQFGKG